MIETACHIGKEMLDETCSDEERTEKFLESQALVPNERALGDDKAAREVVIDLNIKKGQIEIKTGEELSKDKKNNFFAFSSPSRGKKKYFTTNNFYYHLYSIQELIDFIEDKKVNFDKSVEDFLSFLKKIKHKFYKEQAWKKDSDKKEYYLNLKEKLTPSLKRKYEKYWDEDKNASLKKVLKKIERDEVLGIKNNEFRQLNIFSLKINGKYPHSKNFKFQQEYLEVVKYDQLLRYYTEMTPDRDAYCTVCNTQKLVTGKIDIPTKFFITDEPSYFENINKNNSHRSFALCARCYQNLKTGVKHIQDNFSNSLLGLYYYLIPRKNTLLKSSDSRIGYITDKLLKYDPSNPSETIEKYSDLINKMEKNNLRFDFLFHWTPEGQGASFVVADFISDVEFHHIVELQRQLRKLNNDGFYQEFRYPVNLNSLYWLLFPNKKSHNKPPDTSAYRKELLQFYNALLRKQSISYQNFLRRFLFILRKTWFNKGDEKLQLVHRTLQAHILIELYNQFSSLKKLNHMGDPETSFTEIPDDKIVGFFETHENIYENNPKRKGLVLLGLLINEIIKKQLKDEKSSTFLDKMNFDGIAPKRMPQLINEVTEYLNIYQRKHSLFSNNQLRHACMQDRLQGIEDASLTKDETVFYILTGVSLGRYLAYDFQTQNGQNNE